METKYGTIIKPIRNKGYGFIKPDDEELNIFFHAKRVLGSKFEQLKICEEVEYLEEDTYKGKQAVDVVIK